MPPGEMQLTLNKGKGRGCIFGARVDRYGAHICVSGLGYVFNKQGWALFNTQVVGKPNYSLP